jgi:hypothetical protein
MTKIKYIPSRLKVNYNMGFVFIVLGILFELVSFFLLDFQYASLNSVGVGLLGGGIFMLGRYAFETSKQYLSLHNGVLIKNNVIPLKIKLNEIIAIREFAGDLKLKTETFEFVIDTQIIEPSSLEVLKNELMNLDVTYEN